MESKIRVIVKEFYRQNKAKLVFVYTINGKTVEKEMPSFMSIESAEATQALFKKINSAC